ncbi:uncharacterized protein KIAA0825 homolog isoform X2 [Scyliorhinus canicula]|uniref:uncharacterized protein KIAA0825 homolog isoform X2 n=1 Tax=Scyliorhinus canicula TaxID=7830 RepID=UPI0018F7C690|nr:uncharacterized protein KIAA0825 homolog isoform X2 [Scyliorhinus canicula]
MAWEGDYLLDYSCSGCLLDTIPGEVELRQTLGDIEENLKQNSVCIENTVRELQSDLNRLCIGEKLQNTGDCLQWLSSYNISCVKPFTTPCDQLTNFLKAVLHFLKTEEGPEEMIMQLLLDLSAECGVVFPLNSCGASFHVPSTTSAHAIEFNDSLDALSVWDDVKLHLRRFLVDKLQNCQGMNNMLPNIKSKAQCLQRLLFLYPETEVLTKYQSIQCKSVQDLLQGNILTNTDEISFDKVACGFENMIPVVCTMMRQDLYALRTLVEDTKVLKFINDAYLQNIAEELYVITEKLCAQQLRKNVQHLAKTNKNLNKQKGAVQFAVPQEQTKEVRNLCLMAHQLRCLSHLMKILIHFEKRMDELTSEVFLGSFSIQHGRNVRGVLKKTLPNNDVPSEMNRAHIQAEQLLHVTEPVSLECDWRNAFKGLASSIADCVKMVIEDTCSGCLQRETNQYVSTKSLATCTHPVKTTWDLYMEEEQPKKVAKFCSDIMEELDMLLPLALVASESYLQGIRENFLDGCSKVAVDILTRLEERSKEVPSKVPAQNLYVILSTAIFTHNCLTIYENLLKESNIKSLFLLRIQQYQEFIRGIQFQVTNYCIRVCATSIFQDAQSHHWDDSKSFYEGERCSFSIQMWYYYCCALRYDLWSVLPSRLAQELLSEVLSESLAILACRYSQSCPTYNRTSQIRIDITAILVCTENLLWSVCRSAQELLQPSEDMSRWIFIIHNHCNTLLTALAVLTSPLDKLYDVFCNRFSEYNSALPLESVNSGVLDWLHWIQLSCFSNELRSSTSSDKVAVEQHLMLLLSQPNCNWNLLLQILMLKDCLVPRILLNSTSIDQENFADIPTKAKNNDEQSKLIEAIVMVMTYSKSLPRCLSIVLDDYLDKYQMWNQLCYLSAANKSEVLRCLNLYISKASKTVLKQVISLVLMWQSVEYPSTYHHKQMLPESLLSKIPKEWDYIPREFKRRESGKNLTEVVAQAVSVVIGNLPAAIASLPSTIKYLFNLAETKLQNNIPELRKSCLLCYVMTICQTLEDGNAIELLTSVTIDRWSKDKLGLLSECLQTIMGKQKESPKPIIQKVINCLEKQKPKWIDAQLQKATELCTEDTFLTDEDRFAQEKSSFTELTKQKISMLLMDICHQPGGSEYLRQIYHTIQLNEDWLKEQIYSQRLSDEERVPQKPCQLTLHGFQQPLLFNPLHAFNHIGSSNFNQSAITEWNWDWSKVLHSNLGLSQFTFRALLANRINEQHILITQFQNEYTIWTKKTRWEMQAETILEANEKNMIEHLQKIYFSNDKDT